MRHITLALALALALVATPEPVAQPHLIPEVGTLAGLRGYEAVLAERLNPDGWGDRDLLLLAVLRIKYGPERLVGVRRTGSGYEAFAVVPEESLWYEGWQVVREEGTTKWNQWLPEAARRVPIAHHAAPLDSATAALLQGVWARVILETRHPAPEDVTISTGGVMAHFSTWVLGRGVISGETRSPPDGSPADRLVRLGFALERYARGAVASASGLRAEAERLTADPVAGCYRLEHGPWPEGLDHLPDPARLPDLLELTPEPYRGGREALEDPVPYYTPSELEGARAVRYPGQPDSAGPFTFWQRLGDGSLLLHEYLPPGGFTLRMRQQGEELVGQLIGSTDFIPPGRSPETRVPARLIREACDEREPSPRPR